MTLESNPQVGGTQPNPLKHTPTPMIHAQTHINSVFETFIYIENCLHDCLWNQILKGVIVLYSPRACTITKLLA
jgi:hypothetical protein